MDDQEARRILSVYRIGEVAPEEADLQEARRKADADPALARWWHAEQDLDRVIATKLAAMPVPSDLKARLLAGAPVRPRAVRPSWSRHLLAAAAALVLLGVLFSSWRGPFQPAISLADYRDEMVSFIKVAPNLELESSEFARLQQYLAKANAPAAFSLPKNLQQYEPIGCRVLRFRGHDVSLVCFQLGEDKLGHLFITDSRYLLTKGSMAAPKYTTEQGWITATWSEGGQTYLLTAKGDRPFLEKLLSTS